MSSLKEHRVYAKILGRMLKLEELAKEVNGTGFQSLTSGEKNPLSDFIDLIEKLKKRRRMKPVSSLTAELPIPMQQTTESPNSSRPLHEPEIQQSIESHTPESEPEDPEDDSTLPTTEAEQFLEDLEKEVFDEPTLLRLSEADVAYNMDEEEIEESGDEVEEVSSSSDSSGEGEETG